MKNQDLEKRFAEIRRKTRKIDKRLKAILDFIETITTNENLKNEKKGF